MKKLHLNLKFKFFDQIESGEKTIEYRLKDKYSKKMQHKYDAICLHRGYTSRTITFRFEKPKIVKMVCECYGDSPVELFAFPLKERIFPNV